MVFVAINNATLGAPVYWALLLEKAWGGCLWIMVAATSWCLDCSSAAFGGGYINVSIDCSAPLTLR